MANPFVYVELHTKSPDQAKDFYRRLFDWKLNDIQAPGFGTYTEVKTVDGGVGGGMTPTQGKDEPSHWLTYIGVDDIKSATKKAKDLGGTALQEDIEVPKMGRFSVVRDPTGAVFALWQKLG
jgi:predicted enzyme related to lactoylglutathione lyase